MLRMNPRGIWCLSTLHVKRLVAVTVLLGMVITLCADRCSAQTLPPRVAALAASDAQQIGAKLGITVTSTGQRIGWPNPVQQAFEDMLRSSLFPRRRARITQKDVDHAFSQPGNFLHLVKQAVRIEAESTGHNVSRGAFVNAVGSIFGGHPNLFPGQPKPLDPGRPYDPNSLAGPVFSAYASMPYTYTINFENINPTPATTVTITQTIPGNLDITTLVLSDATLPTGNASQWLYPTTPSGAYVGFGSLSFPGTSGPVNYSLGNGITLQVNIVGATVTWTLTFLPPPPGFQQNGLGQNQSGSLSFQIGPIVPQSLSPSWQDYVSLVSMPYASIVFDTNSPQNTNPWP